MCNAALMRLAYCRFRALFRIQALVFIIDFVSRHNDRKLLIFLGRTLTLLSLTKYNLNSHLARQNITWLWTGLAWLFGQKLQRAEKNIRGAWSSYIQDRRSNNLDRLAIIPYTDLQGSPLCWCFDLIIIPQFTSKARWSPCWSSMSHSIYIITLH